MGPPWVFVCDNCGKEWALTEEEQVRAHERKYKHSVYQQKKEAVRRKKPKDRKE